MIPLLLPSFIVQDFEQRAPEAKFLGGAFCLDECRRYLSDASAEINSATLILREKDQADTVSPQEKRGEPGLAHGLL